MRISDWSSDVCSSDLVIATGDNETSEVYLLPADNPEAEMQLVSARKKGREYSVDERGGTLYIHTNAEHHNFRVANADIKDPDEWNAFIPVSSEHTIPGLSSFHDYFVLPSRRSAFVAVDVRIHEQ